MFSYDFFFFFLFFFVIPGVFTIRFPRFSISEKQGPSESRFEHGGREVG